MRHPICSFVAVVAALALPAAIAHADGQRIVHDMSKCNAGKGPAVKISINSIKNANGNIRVVSYPATKAAWLVSGKWINRFEVPAVAGSMTVCMPVPTAGNYGIAILHDKNGNQKVDLGSDGGGMSNNPAINIWNLGKPSVDKVRFYAGTGITQLTINMRYKVI